MSISFGSVEVTDQISGDGISGRKRIRAASTANIADLTTLDNGGTLDGVTLATDDRILLKDQTTGTDNGIYVVQPTGAPVRSADYDVGDSVGNTLLTILEGTTNDNTIWLCTNDSGTDIVGTDSLAFIRTSSFVNSVTAIDTNGAPNVNGLTVDGDVLNLNTANASFGGVVSTNAQTFAGAKTFSNGVVTNAVNDNGGDLVVTSAATTDTAITLNPLASTGGITMTPGSTSAVEVTGGNDALTHNSVPVVSTITNVGTGAGLIYKGRTAQSSDFRSILAGTNITVTNNTNDITIAGIQSYSITNVAIGDSPYTILEADDFIAVNSSGGAITLTLPVISGLTTPNNYKRYTITDTSGNAHENNITVVAGTGNTIIGVSPSNGVVVNDNYNSISIYSNGTNAWHII